MVKTYPEAIVSPRAGVVIAIDEEAESSQTIVDGDDHSGGGVSNVLSIVEESIGVSLRHKLLMR